MYIKRCLLVLLVAVLIAVQAPAFSANVGDTGPEIWVDGPVGVYPGLDPRTVDASVDHLGTQVFVWANGSAGTPGLEVYLRRFNPTGDALADPAQVNTYEDGSQLNPRVAIAADGSFLVIWQSFEPPEPGDDFQRIMIRSQAYNVNAQPVGSEQIVSSLQTLLPTDASADVAALTGGGFIVVWESRQSVNGADSSYTIQGRRVAANGVPLGAQFQVNSLISSERESDSAVTAMTDGGFLVVWARPQIHARRFSANATPAGPDFQINTYTSIRDRDEIDVALNDDGRIFVVWADEEERLTETEIRGRMFDQNLVALGADFRINTYDDGRQDQPKVGNYGEEGFFVVWTSEGSSGPDVEPTSIEGRVVKGFEAFTGQQFLINQYTPERQQHPAIGGRGGLLAIAWFSGKNDVVDNNVILGQFWTLCGIYCDGFE